MRATNTPAGTQPPESPTPASTRAAIAVSAALAAVEETVHQIAAHTETAPTAPTAPTGQDGQVPQVPQVAQVASTGQDGQTGHDGQTGSAGQDGQTGAGAQDGAGETASTDDVLAALAGLRAVQDRLAAWEPLLIGAARARGASWAAIAPALGVASRQAAERRYLRLNPHTTDPADMTGEERVQAARSRRAGDRAVNQWARTNAARLRRLAAQITALDGLDPATQKAVDRIFHALGDPDTATLLSPLADAGARLRHSHPTLAEQAADVTATTDQLRHPN
ncbi:hypothetical protein [Kribbella sp.]|uniref:hypothetical protein n=1 Tax=Kribbella sp. TaxID=1871183 RepID=UPI002D653191|nr:hypothetical protein [Kribbella sp.]HZX03768.1 hypothetical protein [Kribbella sp.]